MPSGARVNDASTIIDLFYRTTVNGATLSMAVSDVGTGTDANTVSIAGCYKAA
jgi:hypothetical protein